MAALGRWGAVDPHADRYPGASPYNYVLGNPTSLVDPDGRDPTYPARFLAGGLVSMASETAIQGLEMMLGARESMDFGDIVVSGAAGAVTGGFTTVRSLGRLQRVANLTLNLGVGAGADYAMAHGGSDTNPDGFNLAVSVTAAVLGEAAGEAIEGAHRASVRAADPVFQGLTRELNEQGTRYRGGRRTLVTLEAAELAVDSYRGTESAAVGSTTGSVMNRITNYIGSVMGGGDAVDRDPIPSR
jgi:hypothetical protein